MHVSNICQANIYHCVIDHGEVVSITGTGIYFVTQVII